jgi:hypothetical protein
MGNQTFVTNNLKEKLNKKNEKESLGYQKIEQKLEILGDSEKIYSQYFLYLLPNKKPSDEILKLYSELKYIENEFSIEELQAFFEEYKKDMGKNLQIKLILSCSNKNNEVILNKPLKMKIYDYILKLVSEFGSLHIGLQIGPMIIDWNQYGICEPRPFKSQAISILDLNSKLELNDKNLKKVKFL